MKESIQEQNLANEKACKEAWRKNPDVYLGYHIRPGVTCLVHANVWGFPGDTELCANDFNNEYVVKKITSDNVHKKDLGENLVRLGKIVAYIE